MSGRKALGCVAAAVACVALLGAGCGKKPKVCVWATVDTQWASLDNMLYGTHPNFGGLTARIIILTDTQCVMQSRLDRATQAAQDVRREADRIADNQEEAVQNQAQAAAESAVEAMSEADGVDEEVRNPSGG
jgi:hypothetical protein